MLNKTRYEDSEIHHSKPKEGSKNIICIGKESYLNELVLNSKRIQRMQDFIDGLDAAATNHT